HTLSQLLFKASSGLHLRILDSRWRRKICQADLMFGMLQLTRPLLGVTSWSYEWVYSDWRLLSGFDDYWSLRKHSPLLETSITSHDLRRIFIDLRELLAAEEFIAHHHSSAPSSVFRWMEGRRDSCQSKLLEIYAGGRSTMRDAQGVSRKARSQESNESFLAL